MTTNHVTSRATGNLEPGGTPRDGIGRLFAAALDGDRRAEAALHLLGAFDDTAHRASWALLGVDHDSAQVTSPNVLASINRTLAALREHRPQ